MRELTDAKLMNAYIEQDRIRSLFDTERLPFRLYRFEKGEILNDRKAASASLQFVVKGTLRIYAVHQDGSRYALRQVDRFTVLGDAEFCGAAVSPFLVEAQTAVLCVTLPLWGCKEALLRDNRLLRFLLQSVSEKLQLFSKSEAEFSSLDEKLLHYIRTECPEKKITDVGKTVFQLRCSRRQLQRVLKRLTERGCIQKRGKGYYQFIEESDPLAAQK